MAAPTSTNEVTARKFSSSISALWTKIKSTFQTLGNLVTTWGSTPSDTKYPSEKLVKDSLDGKQAALAFDGTYNASTNKAATVSTVTNAISGLDVSSVGGNGKYISAISETDGKISATATTMDTTPTANSTNAVTSGGIKTALDAKAPNAVTTEVAIATNDKLIFSDASDSGKLKRMGTGFDTSVSTTVLKRNGTFGKVLYADAAWGGEFRGSLAPGDTYFLQQRNVFFGPKPSAISVEYSTDGGQTWLDYGLTDDQKRQLFSQFHGCSIYCGKNTHILPTYTGSIVGTKDLSDENVADQRLRITICCEARANAGTTATTDKWIYANLRRIGMYMSTNSASRGPRHCVFSGRSKPNFRAGNDVWTVFGDYAVAGDSGWNSIPCNNATTEDKITFGNSYDNHYDEIRFEIWSEGVNATPAASQTGNMMVNKIVAFSELCWQQSGENSNIANYGLPCTVSPVSGSSYFAKGLTCGVAIPLGSGGTGGGSATAAEYNILSKARTDLSAYDLGDTNRIPFLSTSPSSSGGIIAGYRTTLSVWNWIKGKISSVLGLSTTGYTGNAATATKATQDSDGNAINATYFKSSGNTTLVAGAATKIGTQNGADVKLTLPAHQDISGKMNTSASNATAPSSSGGDGATATLLNNLSDGNSDIVTTDNGDNVLIVTTDNGGSVTNKWYKRKLVKLIPWIIKKLGTGLVYDCGAGSTSGDDFDAALAAFNAGQWVIIHKDNNVYYCVGTYNSGLRFKQLANDASLLKVNTLNWTRGSSPSVGTQIEASLSGHTHSQYLTASDITGKMATDCSNKASGALQNLTEQLTEGTSDFTDNTEIFTSYAGNGGFAEAGHVNQPYRRKASSMLNYIADSGLAQLVQVYGNSVKKIEIGYATIADTGNSSEMKALVELTCVSQSSTSQPGSSMLMLVSVSCTNTNRFAKATILENTFWDGRTRPVIVTKVVSNRMYVYVGLLANNGTSLVSFDYTYAKITRIGHVNNWSWEHEYTSDGTFDHIFYCDDSVKFVPTVNSNTIGTTAGIASGSPADACVTYWSAMQPGCIRMVYNQNGTEYTILFSKSSDGKYGSILKWSYTDNYMRIIRIQNNSVLTGADWVKISAGYADSAGSLSSSVSVGSANQPVYFNNGSPTVCNWCVS